jgi:hypothetical protein
VWKPPDWTWSKQQVNDLGIKKERAVEDKVGVIEVEGGLLRDRRREF